MKMATIKNRLNRGVFYSSVKSLECDTVCVDRKHFGINFSRIKCLTAFALFFYLLPAIKLNAQGKINPKDYPAIYAKVDSLINNFNRYSTLTDPLEPDHISEQYVDKFKELFKPEATIDDELGVSWYDGDKNLKTYLNFVKRDVNSYVLKRKEFFDKGLDEIKVLNTDIAYNNLGAGEVIVIMERTSRATISKSGITVASTPILQIDLVFSNKFKTLQISSVRMVVENDAKTIRKYKHSSNDDDYDFNADYDEDSKYPSLSSSDGRPTPEEIRQLKEMGFTFDAKFNLDLTGHYGIITPEIVDFVPQAMIANYDLASAHSSLITPLAPSITMSSVGANLFATYFFGIKARYGITAGVRWDRFSGTISSPAMKVGYKSVDQFGSAYLRILSSTDLSEDFSGNSFSIPVMGRWKVRMGKRLNFELAAGANFNLLFTAKSNLTAGTFNYEARYVYQDGGTTVFPTPDNTSSKNQVIWEEGTVNFDELRNNQNYDLALNFKPDNVTGDADFKGNIAIIAAPQFVYKIGSQYFGLLGVSYATNVFSFADAGNYRVSDTVGEYFTMLRSLPKISAPVLSINIGIRYAFTND